MVARIILALLPILPTFLNAQIPASHPALKFIKSFGGSGFSSASAIAVDRSGNVYIAGSTNSLDFPTKSAYQPKIGGANLRVSGNAGATWQAPSIPFPVYAISNSPKRPNTIFAGTTNGVYKSVDSGTAWQPVASFPLLKVEALLVNPENPDLICAATLNGIYRSADAGVTWRKIDLPIPQAIALASSPARPATLYSAADASYGFVSFGPAANEPRAGPANVYRSVDNGASWAILPGAPSGVFAIACDPVNPDTVYAANAEQGFSQGGATSLFKTLDAGATWVKTADLPIVTSTFTLAVTQTAIYLGTPSGLRISRDGGATFSGTSITASTDNVAVDPANPNIVYANADRLYRSADGGATWTVSLQVRQEVDTLAVLSTVPPSVFVGSTPGGNAFLTKWNADGSQMLYSTYLGGSDQDRPTAIAVDNQGNAVVAGYSFSLDFPVTPGAMQPVNRGAANAFLAKIGPNGDKLLYSSYLGGSGRDAARAIALDSAGNAYLTGYTGSLDFPVTQGSQPDGTTPGQGNAFITALDTGTGRLIYSTLFGGSDGDQGLGITVDNAGTATIVGVTESANIPIDGAATEFTNARVKGFLVQVNPQGRIARSIFLPGVDGSSTADAIAQDAAGSLYVTGSGQGGNSPPPESFVVQQLEVPTSVGLPAMQVGAAYVLKLNPRNLDREYLAYIGGGVASGIAIAVDPSGRAWVAGNRADIGGAYPFSLIYPFQEYSGYSFLAELSADGSKTLFSSATDFSEALALSSTSVFAAGAQFIRVDFDVPRLVSVNAPERLFPTQGSTYGEGIVPGEFVSIRGENLGPGTTVTFDGIPAQLLSVSPDRVTCIVPFAIDPNYFHVIDMQLTSNSGQANQVRLGEGELPLALTSAANSDGMANTESTPASPGSIISIYGSGFGQTDPPTVDGISAAAVPRTFLARDPVAWINGEPAAITYIGAAPGQLTAVTQINLRVPSEFSAGKYRVGVGFGTTSGTLDIYIGQ